MGLIFHVSICWLLFINVHGQTGYIEYLPGDLPIILSSPHGGSQSPDSLPTRPSAGCWNSQSQQCIFLPNCGTPDSSRCRAVTSSDLYTKELTELISENLLLLTGESPSVIINNLHRRKYDANRDIGEACFGGSVCELAFEEYHTYINQSKAELGRGLFFDIHGHGHPEPWAELGYLITGSNLDAGVFNPDATSIRYLASQTAVPFEQLLRGPTSFGGFVEREGFDAVPSPEYPGPGGASYFSGGFNTRLHGSRDGGMIDAIQIESARVMRDPPLRPSYAAALAQSMVDMLETYYGYVRKI